MQKLAKIAFWALSIVMASPLAAFAEQAADAAVATGLPYMGFAIGGGIAVGFAGLGCDASCRFPIELGSALRRDRRTLRTRRMGGQEEG